MINRIVVFLVFGIIVNSCAPTATDRWYKGNLHTHSFWSDGNDFPEMIMKWYKEHDYQFVALTEHNIIAKGEKWIGMAEDTLYRNAFARYLESFGHTDIQHKEDSGRLSVLLKTLEEYRPLFEEPEEFLIIQAEEITAKFERRPIHLNATNLSELIEPKGGESVVEVLQNNIDAVRDQRAATGHPILVHVNHPNFHFAISVEDMIALEGEQFFEVFNGHPQVHNEGDTAHVSTEKMWDLVNIAYRQNGKPLLYGLATDDAHEYHRQGKTWSNAGRGWVMVQADSLSASTIIESLERGSFYASTGVTLSNLTARKNKLLVEVDAEEGISYEIVFIGCQMGEKEVKELKRVNGTKGHFRITEDIAFVRAKIISNKRHQNPIENLNYEMAWTQPVVYDGPKL
ncbi:MAG: histidinol-phosphatase [Saprospiraceae bacterium]|nr:histidinol-phosphatase [Saprospiraceae bacterium]